QVPSSKLNLAGRRWWNPGRGEPTWNLELGTWNSRGLAMTDENTPKADEKSAEPTAHTPASAVTHPPADIGREPIDAPELTAASEAAEVVPAAEVAQDIVEPMPVPAPEPEPVSAEVPALPAPEAEEA